MHWKSEKRKCSNYSRSFR